MGGAAKTAYMDGTAKEKASKYVTDMKNMVISKVEWAKLEGTKLLGAGKEKYVALKSESPESLKLKITDKAKKTACQLKVHVEKKVAEVVEKSGPVVKNLSQTSLFKKGMQMAVACSEKTLGKEKTGAVLSKIKAR